MARKWKRQWTAADRERKYAGLIAAYEREREGKKAS